MPAACVLAEPGFRVHAGGDPCIKLGIKRGSCHCLDNLFEIVVGDRPIVRVHAVDHAIQSALPVGLIPDPLVQC